MRSAAPRLEPATWWDTVVSGHDGSSNSGNRSRNHKNDPLRNQGHEQKNMPLQHVGAFLGPCGPVWDSCQGGEGLGTVAGLLVLLWWVSNILAHPPLTLSANILASRAAVWHSYPQRVVRDHSKIIKPALYFGPPDFIPTMQLLTLHSHDSKNRNKQNIIWKLSISRCKSLQFCPFKHSLLLLSCCRLLTSRRFSATFSHWGSPWSDT